VTSTQTSRLPERHAEIAVGARVSVSATALASRARTGHVIEVAPDVAELPPRFRASPAIPVRERRLAVQLEGPAAPLPSASSSSPWLPGQELRVRY
jgi:hypothetical protein